jgi:hypothetical protein
MFELLDDDRPSPHRLPPPALRNDPSFLFDDLLIFVWFGGLVLGGSLAGPRVVKLGVWLAAGGAGWWFVYRFVRRMQALALNQPARRKQIAVRGALCLLAFPILVYVVAIDSETLANVVFGLAILMLGVQYLIQRRRVSP